MVDYILLVSRLLDYALNFLLNVDYTTNQVRSKLFVIRVTYFPTLGIASIVVCAALLCVIEPQTIKSLKAPLARNEYLPPESWVFYFQEPRSA